MLVIDAVNFFVFVFGFGGVFFEYEVRHKALGLVEGLVDVHFRC